MKGCELLFHRWCLPRHLLHKITFLSVARALNYYCIRWTGVDGNLGLLQIDSAATSGSSSDTSHPISWRTHQPPAAKPSLLPPGPPTILKAPCRLHVDTDRHVNRHVADMAGLANLHHQSVQIYDWPVLPALHLLLGDHSGRHATLKTMSRASAMLRASFLSLARLASSIDSRK